MSPARILGACLLLGCAAAQALTPAQVFAKVSDSVWKVVTYDADGLPLGIGSAVVIEPETLVTNCHVLGKATRVALRREKRSIDAKLMMWDVERDLCRLKAPGLAAPAVVLVESAKVVVGENVYAIGNPQNLDLTMSSGLLSGIRRNDSGQIVLFQTSAAISGGSSGGGLFDEQARLIGLTTLGSVGDLQNLNFAIPADWIRELPQRHAALNGADSKTADETSLVAGLADLPASKPAPAAKPPGVPKPKAVAGGALRAGDEFEYTISDSFTGTTRRAIYRVDRIEGDEVLFNGGARAETRDGKLLRIDSAIGGDMDALHPPTGWVAEDAATQLRWSLHFEGRDRGLQAVYDLDGWLEGEVTVTTPAGDFRATVVSYEGWARRYITSTSIQQRVKLRVWYAPALRRVVRFESDIRPSSSGIYMNTSSREVAELTRIGHN